MWKTVLSLIMLLMIFVFDLDIFAKEQKKLELHGFDNIKQIVYYVGVTEKFGKELKSYFEEEISLKLSSYLYPVKQVSLHKYSWRDSTGGDVQLNFSLLIIKQTSTAYSSSAEIELESVNFITDDKFSIATKKRYMDRHVLYTSPDIAALKNQVNDFINDFIKDIASIYYSDKKRNDKYRKPSKELINARAKLKKNEKVSVDSLIKIINKKDN